MSADDRRPGPEDVARRLRAAVDDELGDVRADGRLLAGALARTAGRRRRRVLGGRLAVLPAWALPALGVVPVVGLVVVVALLLSARGAGRPAVPLGTPPPAAVPGGPPSAGPTGPTSPAPATSTAPSAPTPSAPARPTCSPQTSDPGTGGAVADLDGDGTPDAVTYDGVDRVLRVTLGGGRGVATTPFTTASPYVTVLAVPVGAGRAQGVLVTTRGAIGGGGSVGGVGRLFALRGCDFGPVPGVDGKPYDFLVGTVDDAHRAGVVCSDGVLYGRTSALQDGTWQVTDTPLTVDAGVAVNGSPRRSTVADGTPAAQVLADETCGGPPQTVG